MNLFSVSLRKPFAASLVALLLFGASALAQKEFKSGIEWPEPKVVTPRAAGGPPSDAIILFDGKDLSSWKNGENWKISDGVATAFKSGISTKQAFGDVQLHLEWASPEKVEGNGQGRGNSGVYFMGKYEIQILDSFENKTYFDGQAASIYKQYPPLVNASNKPGDWQTYDIIFNAPRFDKEGKVLKPGNFTVLHNGVLVQNHSELQGGTLYDRPPEFKAHPEKLPIDIQFHGNPVKFRNIWVREFKELLSPEKASVANKLKELNKNKDSK